jgi:alpha-methylacyl-CoA racemase
MSSPLEGVRVLDLSRLLPGPFCTLILAELGAEVVKLEDTGAGDYLRIIPPSKNGAGGAYYALNRGKKSIAIDLKKAEGRELLLRLLPKFDVVVESFRPGVLKRLQLDYPVLKKANPNILLCSITGYGQTGPLANRAGHDINYLALSGTMAVGGEAQGQPALPGAQMADVAGGSLWATIRILAALRTGKGAHIDVSMTEGVMSLLLPWLGDFAFSKEPLKRGEATLTGGAACYNVYKTSDDRHLAVGSLEPKFWASLCSTLGRDVDMSDPVAPPARQAQLKEELAEAFAQQPLDYWQEKLGPADACIEPVLEMEELAQHPQHVHREMFYEIDDPKRGPLEQLRLPLDGEPCTTPAPDQGQHTFEVLEKELGLNAEDLAALKDKSVIR